MMSLRGPSVVRPLKQFPLSFNKHTIVLPFRQARVISTWNNSSLTKEHKHKRLQDWNIEDANKWIKSKFPDAPEIVMDGGSLCQLEIGELAKLFPASGRTLFQRIQELKQDEDLLLNYDPKCPRMNRKQLFGREAGDEELYSDELKQLAKQGQQALQDRNVAMFLQTAFRTIEELEKSYMKGNPLYIDPNLLFVGPQSPGRRVYESIFSKIFEKACAAFHLGKSNNHAGYALCGEKGVGKSNAMQVCTIVSSILLQNIVALYVDFQSFATKQSKPSQYIRLALKKQGVDLDHIREVDALLQSLLVEKSAVVFFGDEIRRCYRDYVWEELHTMTTNHFTFVTLADSTSIMRPLITGDPELLKLGFKEVLPSLNNTKLTFLELKPFSRPEHYKIYLEKRYPEIAKGHLSDEHALNGLHAMTDGRIRNIVQYLEGNAIDADPKVIPDNTSVQYEILMALVDKQKTEGRFNPFQPITLPEHTVKEIIDAHNKHNSAKYSWRDLMKWVEDGMFRKIQDGSADAITFGKPSQFLQIQKWIPGVFISHATGDIEVFKPLAEQLKADGIDVHFAPFLKDQVAMATIGLKPWMHQQIDGGLNGHIMIACSPNYLKRIQVKDSGVQEEFYYFLELLRKDPTWSHRLILVVHDEQENALEYVPEDLRHLNLLYFKKTADYKALYAKIVGGSKEPKKKTQSHAMEQ